MSSDDQLIVADGYDEAFIGVGYRGGERFAAYDHGKLIGILMERDEMSRDDALDFFDFNIAGSSIGDSMPVYVDMMPLADYIYAERRVKF